MRILINKVINQKSDYRVNFSTAYGSAIALWKGNKPELDKEYFVEIEVSNVFCWQKDIVVTHEKCSILSEGNTVQIVAVFESIEKDGYTVLRLGDSIISIETQGEVPPLGSNVKLTANNLILYEVMY